MNYLITTSIPYLNDSPHLGHLYEFILADIFARYWRYLNNEVFFLSGTDENGMKIARTAQEKKMAVKDFVDEKYKEFYALKEKFNLSFDNFIRTTSLEHQQGVYKFWKLCEKDIYLGEYKGFYCLSCESYYDESEAPQLICPLHKKKLEKFEEKNYFFQLTKYLPTIKKLIEEDKIKIYPQEKKIEILNILKNEQIRDLSISRDSQRSGGWGLPVPNDSQQVIYVWFDALINYLSGLGFGSDDESYFEKFWKNGQVIHLIGKDIVKFHAIYWPAMLLSAKIKTPDKIVVHYFINIKGEKMSKTIGNVVSPDDLLQYLKPEEIRAYLAYQNIFKDWDFDVDGLIRFKEGILKKELGNLILRIFGLVKKASEKIVLKENYLEKDSQTLFDKYHFYMNLFEINNAYLALFELIKKINYFIDQEKLWTKMTDDYASTLLINLMSILDAYQPLMPNIMSNIKKNLFTENNIYLNQKISLAPIFE
jgi:methionyl-tRNA synthetase